MALFQPIKPYPHHQMVVGSFHICLAPCHPSNASTATKCFADVAFVRIAPLSNASFNPKVLCGIDFNLIAIYLIHASAHSALRIWLSFGLRAIKSIFHHQMLCKFGIRLALFTNNPRLSPLGTSWASLSSIQKSWRKGGLSMGVLLVPHGAGGMTSESRGPGAVMLLCDTEKTESRGASDTIRLSGGGKRSSLVICARRALSRILVPCACLLLHSCIV